MRRELQKGKHARLEEEGGGPHVVDEVALQPLPSVLEDEEEQGASPGDAHSSSAGAESNEEENNRPDADGAAGTEESSSAGPAHMAAALLKLARPKRNLED